MDFECRLASLLCLVFKDCSGLESALKVSKTGYLRDLNCITNNWKSFNNSFGPQMLTIVGPFLEKRQIRQIFSPNFCLLQQHFREELESCNRLFKSQLNQVVFAEIRYCQYAFIPQLILLMAFIFYILSVEGQCTDKKHGAHIGSFEVGKNAQRTH